MLHSLRKCILCWQTSQPARQTLFYLNSHLFLISLVEFGRTNRIKCQELHQFLDVVLIVDETKHWITRPHCVRCVQSQSLCKMLEIILLLTYKVVHGHAPAYSPNLISFITLKSLRSVSQIALKPGPCSKTSSYRDRAFAVAAPKLWNNIPYNIHSAASISQFKTQLKTFLFN